MAKKQRHSLLKQLSAGQKKSPRSHTNENDPKNDPKSAYVKPNCALGPTLGMLEWQDLAGFGPARCVLTWDVSKQSLCATFHVETDHAKHLLESNIGTLLKSLAVRKMRVGAVEVVITHAPASPA